MSKIALVTGSSRGLGRNTALSIARQGGDVIVTYHSRADDAERVVAEIEALGRKAVALQLDTGTTAGFPDFVEWLRAVLDSTWQRQSFDHLVNNAGHGDAAPFAETTEAQFDTLLNVHLKGVFFLTQALLPLLADGGRIVNLSSGLTRISHPGFSAYAAMKGAVEVLSVYMAKELGSRGIAVNCVAPGAIETGVGGVVPGRGDPRGGGQGCRAAFRRLPVPARRHVAYAPACHQRRTLAGRAPPSGTGGRRR